MDSRRLHFEAIKLRQRIQTKIDEAHRSIQRAQSWLKVGDYNKASAENDIARQDYQEVTKLDHEAMIYGQRMTDVETKIGEIDARIGELIRQQNTLIAEIEHLLEQKRSMLGS
jgi:multidrug resistance efflux pump